MKKQRNMRQGEDDGAGAPEMHEGESLESGSLVLRPASLTGIMPSPFASPYPTQRPGTAPSPGVAGELRGYYRRSDGVDRWKPSWSKFGHLRSGTTHKGVDIYARVGTDVVAIADGYAVFYPTASDDLGIKVGMTITGSDGVKYDVIYGHLSSLSGVTRSVRKGELLGKTGCTGNAEDGTCATTNTCGGYSSHLHVAVRLTVGGTYVDPVALFNWTMGYNNDNRDVPCSQAFSALMLERGPGGSGDDAAVLDLTAAGTSEGVSKSYRLASFSDTMTSSDEISLLILENIVVKLTVVSGPFPGVKASIKGRQRLFFHPALDPNSSYTITAAFQNLDADGQPSGAAVRVKLVSIKGEAISDSGLRSLWVDAFLPGSTLDLALPVTLLGTTLEAL